MRPSTLILTLACTCLSLLGCGDEASHDDTPREDAVLGLEGTPPTCGEPDPEPAGACDRACLLGFMQRYLDALVAKDPSKLKVSPTLKYTENGVVRKLGEGLFTTASALVPNARLDFADPVTGNVATQTVVNENGATPVIYSARLKVEDRTITEIEALAVT